MKKFWSAFSLVVLCGCLSPVAVPTVSHWLMEYRGAAVVAKTPKYGIVRLSQIVVDQPYASTSFVVLRKDGTVAFDAHNVFAASPAFLLRNVCLSAMKTSGLFSDVIGGSSGASASVSAEIYVSRIALDCRQEDSRRAVVKLLVRMLNGKTIAATAEGEGVADASDGDYGVAFSKALSDALSSALSKLR